MPTLEELRQEAVEEYGEYDPNAYLGVDDSDDGSHDEPPWPELTERFDGPCCPF